ncbi:uncharacterized protein [Euphorbia lathyris]|uniref:uncharacterized protein n=1 Tax=Euphorbia lathyris TaxID=212925 RepID=UPI0033136924
MEFSILLRNTNTMSTSLLPEPCFFQPLLPGFQDDFDDFDGKMEKEKEKEKETETEKEYVDAPPQNLSTTIFDLQRSEVGKVAAKHSGSCGCKMSASIVPFRTTVENLRFDRFCFVKFA